MTTLAALRADLVDVLTTTEAPAHPHLPARLNAPCKVLEPSDPYVTDDVETLTFDEVRVSFDVFLIVRHGTPAKQTEDLDAMVQEVFDAVNGTEAWFAREVAQPYALVMPDQSSYLTTRVRVSTDVRLTR